MSPTVTIQLITAIDERDPKPGESNNEWIGCDAREEVEQSSQTSEQQSGYQEKPSFYRLQYSTIRESRTHSVGGVRLAPERSRDHRRSLRQRCLNLRDTAPPFGAR